MTNSIRASNRPTGLISRGAPQAMLIALLGGMFLGNIDTAVANTATPAIAAGLGASGGELALIVSGYVLAYAMLLVPGARLGQRHGYRRMFLSGLAVFVLMSVGCGLAPNGPVLIVARVVQGGAGAVMIAQVLTGIQLHFCGPARVRALGWYSAVLAGSAVIGQAAGGLLISANLFGQTWRPVFLVNLPLGAALFALAVRVLPPDGLPAHRDRLDVVGVVALSAGLLALIVPLVLGRQVGWPWWVWVCLAASMALFVLFVPVECAVGRAGSQPLVDLELLRRPVVCWSLLSGGVSTGAYYALLFVLALYLQQGLGYSPGFSGAALIPWVAAFGVAGPLLGRASAGVRRAAAPAGGLLLAAGFAGIAGQLLAGSTDPAVLIVLLGVGGLGYGAVFSGALDQLTASVAGRHAPDISGLFNTATKVGGVIGVAAFSVLYLAIAPHGGRRAAVPAFTVATAALSGTALLAAASAYLSARLLGRCGPIPAQR